MRVHEGWGAQIGGWGWGSGGAPPGRATHGFFERGWMPPMTMLVPAAALQAGAHSASRPAHCVALYPLPAQHAHACLIPWVAGVAKQGPSPEPHWSSRSYACTTAGEDGGGVQWFRTVGLKRHEGGGGHPRGGGAPPPTHSTCLAWRAWAARRSPASAPGALRPCWGRPRSRRWAAPRRQRAPGGQWCRAWQTTARGSH